MKEVIISNCEKNFVLASLNEHLRLDGRAFQECRKLTIDFGHDWGCCFVSLGDTKVIANVSCEIQQPKLTRPGEGLLKINVELSPMGAPNFEVGKQSELSVHLNRMLEKCIKDSRAIDLESLCIKLNEKVWSLRVDINILNHAGNLLDCASIAAITALAHFKRPDVTWDGENIIIHTHKQRDPIPTTVHHYPVCVSYALFKEGEVVLADPTVLEEGVSEGEFVFAVNAFKEICSVHLGGKALASTTLIYEYASKAASRAVIVVQEIKDAIEHDKERREKQEPINFENIMVKNYNLDLVCEKMDSWKIQDSKKRKKDKGKTEELDMDIEIVQTEIVAPAEDSSEAAAEQKTAENITEDFENSSDESIIEIKPKVENIAISDSGESEEDEVVILN